MSEALELAVVIPTFNELRNVPVLIAKLDAALAAVEQWPQEGLIVANVVEADSLAGDGARDPRHPGARLQRWPDRDRPARR